MKLRWVMCLLPSFGIHDNNEIIRSSKGEGVAFLFAFYVTKATT